MHNTSTQLPRQRLPSSEKDEEWKEKTIDSISKMSEFSGAPGSSRWQMQKAYRFYNGIIDDEDYTHVLRPYGNKRENFPAKLQNYNIIKPIVDLLIGEKAKRPFNFTIKVNNDDVVNRKHRERQKALTQNLMARFLFELKEQGFPVGSVAPDEMPDPPEEVQETFDRNYRDTRAIRGEQSLNYLKDRLEIDRKHQKGWKHWLISGMVCSKRSAGPDEVKYEMLNPLNVDYHMSDDTEFIEDAQWASHRKMAPVNEVIDEFYEELTEKEIDELEDPGRGGTRSMGFIQFDDTNSPKGADTDGRLIEVMEVFWKSMKRIGIVSYTDRFGRPQEKQVESDYDVADDESVEWHWISQVWQGYRIDDKFYKRVEPVPVQRRDMDNPSKCKLPINGRTYSDMNAPNISLVMLGMAYQMSYNIYKFRLENAVAKAKGVLAQLDIDMIPADWDIDDFMYYAEATGIFWTEFNKEGNRMNPQHQTVVDMSMQAIQDYVALLQSIVQEWERLSGVSRQRQGKVQPTETKGGAENAIVQSSYVTEDYFTKYGHFEERDTQALLDYSKWAWINGKSLSFNVDDDTEGMVQIDGIEHMEAEYGVQVSNSREDMETMKELKQLSQAMLQNDVPLSEVMEILDANSISSLKEKVKQAEQSRRQLQQRMKKMEQQAQQKEQQIEQQKIQADLREAEMDNNTKLKIQRMKNHLKQQKMEMEDEQHEKEIELEEEELEVEADLEEKKMEVGDQDG